MANAENDNSENLGPATLALAWIFCVISTLVVALRFYVRIGMQRKFNIDDFSWGLGKHTAALQSNPLAVMYAIKWVYICEFFAIMTPGFGRISYAFLLSNIIPPSKSRRIFLWTVIGIHFVVDVVTVCLTFAQCQPFEGYWDKSIESHCWPPTIQVYIGYLQGSLGSAVDLIMAVFPCSLFWNLRMHWKQKVFLSSVMGLGVFAMIAAIAKTVELRIIGQDDFTYAMAKLAICSGLEGNLVLISASIPTVTPVFKASRNFSDGRRGGADNLNTFLLWKQAQAKNSEGSHGSFKPLGEPTLAAGIRSNEEQKVLQTEAYALRPMDGDDVRDDMAGIRKDISVSITFDQGQQSAQTQHRAREQAWGTEM
uniref:Decarboxylase_GME5538 n=1 Tax=Daldinia eschscholzii IFB-TL01 TaxID=1169046 RepID=A0A109X1P0_9PEZI|nr:decarboxylase_GME5538 [Daldinia eschscholzii IFB-TL01]